MSSPAWIRTNLFALSTRTLDQVDGPTGGVPECSELFPESASDFGSLLGTPLERGFLEFLDGWLGLVGDGRNTWRGGTLDRFRPGLDVKARCVVAEALLSARILHLGGFLFDSWALPELTVVPPTAGAAVRDPMKLSKLASHLFARDVSR